MISLTFTEVIFNNNTQDSKKYLNFSLWEISEAVRKTTTRLWLQRVYSIITGDYNLWRGNKSIQLHAHFPKTPPSMQREYTHSRKLTRTPDFEITAHLCHILRGILLIFPEAYKT